MPVDNEIEANLSVIRIAVEASKDPAPVMTENTVQARKTYEAAMKAHQAKQEELGLAAVQAGFVLATLFLSDVKRIADAQEILAKHAMSNDEYKAMFNHG